MPSNIGASLRIWSQKRRILVKKCQIFPVISREVIYISFAEACAKIDVVRMPMRLTLGTVKNSCRRKEPQNEIRNNKTNSEVKHRCLTEYGAGAADGQCDYEHSH